MGPQDRDGRRRDPHRHRKMAPPRPARHRQADMADLISLLGCAALILRHGAVRGSAMNIPRAVGVVLLGLWIAGRDAHAEECRLHLVSSLQIQASDNAVLVPATVNGVPQFMLVDTGGYSSEVTDDVAKAQKMTPRTIVSGLKVYRANGSKLTSVRDCERSRRGLRSYAGLGISAPYGRTIVGRGRNCRDFSSRFPQPFRRGFRLRRKKDEPVFAGPLRRQGRLLESHLCGRSIYVVG